MTDTSVEYDADYEQMKNWIVQGTVVQHASTGDKLYYVTKVAQVNFQVIDEDGKRWNLRRNSQTTRAPRQDAWTGEKPNAYTNYMKTINSGMTLGSTVRLKSVTHRRKYGSDVYVVIAVSNSNGTMRLAKLGGDNGQYLRGFTTNDLEPVKGSFNEEG